MSVVAMDHFDFLLSSVYDGLASLNPDHLADLRASGLSDSTILSQSFRTVPPNMISVLLGFDPRAVRSALLIPFHDPAGSVMPHVRMKIFPPYTDRHGQTVKYLQPPKSGCRLFFPIVSLAALAEGVGPVWLIEGEKKALAGAQLGLTAVGFCGVDSWCRAGSRELIADFDYLRLTGRLVELVPDADFHTKPHVRRSVLRFAAALKARGARVRLVELPVTIEQVAA